ncbi:MAG: pentapeptide repeat-containing protein [Verrucomicrobia bacterium]|nr:pentapeptide repeat-containing protein [Verrucomicrobiota bacterium]
MAVLKRRTRPEPWARQQAQAKYTWLIPIFALEWGWRWLAYLLSGWAFLEVLEYFGTLSLLVAAVSYFGESKDRLKQKHYQAWQVINSAQGKGGSGGRIDALEELHQDGVLLVGVDVSDAFLQGVDLNGANLLRANFRSADIRDGSFVGAQLEDADLTSANLRHADLQNADLQNANLEDADLFGADLGQANLTGARLAKADLRNTDLHGTRWREIAEIKLANVFGVKNAPAGFLEWAAKMGAVSVESDAGWLARFNLD